MRKLKLRYLVLALLVAISGAGCDNNSGPDGEEDGNPAIVEGRVDTLSANSEAEDTTQARFKQVEGAVVQATHVNAEGNLEPLGEDSAETNAEGEFTLEITAQSVEEVSDRIVLTAEQEGNTATAFVTSPVERGGTARAKPLSIESTSEATVYQQLLAQGDMEQVTTADIDAVITESVAFDIDQDSSLAGEVASALVAKEQAKVEFYNSQGVDVPQGQINDINEIEEEAQRELENRLSTSSEAGVADAYDAFFETYANAEIEAGINSTNAAKSQEVSSRVVVNQLSVLSDTAEVEVRMDAAYNKTFALEAGVQEQLQDLDASQSGLDNIEQAAEQARADIRALEGEVTEEDVRAVFEDFRQTVIAVINDEGELNGETFAAVNAAVTDDGGAKTTLESSLQGNADVLSVMDAYDRYYSDVENTVSSAFDDVVEAGVAAYYTQLVIMINAPA